MASFRLCMKEDFQNKNMSFSPTWAEAPLCDYLPILCSIIHLEKPEFVIVYETEFYRSALFVTL